MLGFWLGILAINSCNMCHNELKERLLLFRRCILCSLGVLVSNCENSVMKNLGYIFQQNRSVRVNVLQ